MPSGLTSALILTPIGVPGDPVGGPDDPADNGVPGFRVATIFSSSGLAVGEI